MSIRETFDPTNRRAQLDRLTEALRANAHEYESGAAWPVASLALYTDIGGWRWGIPEQLGGLGLSAPERLRGYVAAARGDMSAALFITQHEGAVDLLVTSRNEPLRRAWLPRFAAGEALTSIGYSQLTTSRQGGAPALRAQVIEGGFRLEGSMPWVTGAPYIDNVACGAVLDGGEQVLVLLPMAAPGVEVEPAVPLAALNSTHTCEVRCRGVEVPSDAVISGPMPNVLDERTPLRLLLVSATGVGLAWGLVDALAAEAERGPNRGLPGGWEARLERAGRRTRALEARLLALAQAPALDQPAIDALRVDVNDWLLRLSGALMSAAKGGGFRRRSPAQRLAAEAQFFFVWSAAERIRVESIDRLLG